MNKCKLHSKMYMLQAQWFLYSARASVSHRKTHKWSHLPADSQLHRAPLSLIYSCAHLFLRHVRSVQVILCKRSCIFFKSELSKPQLSCENTWIQTVTHFYRRTDTASNHTNCNIKTITIWNSAQVQGHVGKTKHIDIACCQPKSSEHYDLLICVNTHKNTEHSGSTETHRRWYQHGVRKCHKKKKSPWMYCFFLLLNEAQAMELHCFLNFSW